MLAGDASRRLGDLLTLVAGDLAPLREAINEHDREDAGELLLAALLRVASLEAAASFNAGEVGERDADESRADDSEELPVDDPFVDPARPHSSTLTLARQLRMALEDQRELSALLLAHGALSPDEHALLTLERALDSWWTRRLGDGAGAEAHRADRE